MAENKNAKTPADDGQPVAWMMVNKVIGPPSLHWKPQEDWHITWECKPLYTAPPKREWVGLTDQEVMVAAYQAGFDIHEDYENEDDPEAMHWWTLDGESCDDSLLKLRDLIEAKLKQKNGGEYRNGATTERTKLNQENT